MARHRSHSIEFKRQVAQEFVAGETLYALANGMMPPIATFERTSPDVRKAPILLKKLKSG